MPHQPCRSALHSESPPRRLTLPERLSRTAICKCDTQRVQPDPRLGCMSVDHRRGTQVLPCHEMRFKQGFLEPGKRVRLVTPYPLGSGKKLVARPESSQATATAGRLL